MPLFLFRRLRFICLALGIGLNTLACSGVPAQWAITGLAGAGISYMGLMQSSRTNSIRHITDRRFKPRPPDYPIAITGKDYQNPYLELAIVSTRAYDERMIEKAGFADLQRVAREIGGDAVIQVVHNGIVTEEFGYHPGKLMRWGTRFKPAYSLTGIVVRFKRESDAVGNISTK